jgi:hypothetical protein
MAILHLISKAGLSILIRGITEAMEKIEENKKEIKKRTEEAINDSTFYVQGEVKASISGHRPEPTSVDTGRFLNSIGIRILKDKGQVYTKVEYAPYLEYGTSNMAARHHFRNSLERARRKVGDIVSAKISK